jgi:hypothetical protein
MHTVTTMRNAMRQQSRSSASVGWRHLVWLSLLISASVAFSLSLACATPFAAFAAAAALTFSRRRIGAGDVNMGREAARRLHRAPLSVDGEHFCLGVALGVVAALATLVSQRAVKHSIDAPRAVSVAVSFLVCIRGL